MKTKLTPVPSITPLTGSIRRLLRIGLAAAVLVPTLWTPGALAEKRRPSSTTLARVQTDGEKASEPKKPARPSEEVLAKGLEYLLKQQQPDGGWGQGGGWRRQLSGQGGRVEGKDVEDPSDLGNTCVSLVALLRAGHSPKEGNHQQEAAKASEFILQMVEKADDDSLYVTPVRDTQLQVKIGAYVDTFLTGWALSELKDKLPDEAAETRRAAALDKVVRKIERHQQDDGSFAGNRGWASVLSQGLASKALNAASRSGAKVAQSTLEKDQRQNADGLDVEKGDFSATASPKSSDAGIALYREASKLGGLREKVKSNEKRRKEVDKILSDPNASADAKQKAEQERRQFGDDAKAAQVAGEAVAGKLSSSTYVAGFGNNGGEEFLSYLNLTESMHERGGEEWDDWKGKMQQTLGGAQNEDGSWSGHHCITGRIFCTATALLTLLVEKTTASTKTSAAFSDKPKSEETSKAQPEKTEQ
jgi:hypothetical protein